MIQKLECTENVGNWQEAIPGNLGRTGRTWNPGEPAAPLLVPAGLSKDAASRVRCCTLPNPNADYLSAAMAAARRSRARAAKHLNQTWAVGGTPSASGHLVPAEMATKKRVPFPTELCMFPDAGAGGRTRRRGCSVSYPSLRRERGGKKTDVRRITSSPAGRASIIPAETLMVSLEPWPVYVRSSRGHVRPDGEDGSHRPLLTFSLSPSDS